MLTIPFALCCLVIKEKPDKPPNKYAVIPTEPFFHSLQMLMNRKFLIPMLAFSTCCLLKLIFYKLKALL